jgi:hypothetical protein
MKLGLAAFFGMATAGVAVANAGVYRPSPSLEWILCIGGDCRDMPADRRVSVGEDCALSPVYMVGEHRDIAARSFLCGGEKEKRGFELRCVAQADTPASVNLLTSEGTLTLACFPPRSGGRT